ncbi:hypothetical protein ACSS7Z_01030 [Microbacterium sp. A82]|uniref:hypothetical protein n=1 Tax=unclassified Microbacterium TaxID=2609290 RepID=UPI003F34643D
MTRRSVPTRIAGGALAVVTAAMLTGCFANPLDAIVENATQQSAQNAAEDIIKQVTGGEAGIDIGELPADFPEEIPLVSDNILQSMTLPEGTMVILDDSRGIDEVAAQVKADFADWEEVAFVDMDQMVSAAYKKGEINVNVALLQGADDEPTRVSYILPNPEAE